MFGCGNVLVSLYAKKHWPSKLPKELSFNSKDLKLAKKIALLELKKGATNSGVLVRLTGQSGSGKTTQLLPAAGSYFEKKNLKPIIIRAQELAKYHPYYEEILKKYGEAEIRKRTDDFATILMYLVVKNLTKKHYDLIIDVSFVSPKIEMLLMMMTKKYKERLFLMMALPLELSEKLLEARKWRHDKKMEKEFYDATEKSLKFYGKYFPEIHIVIWGFDKPEPIYGGEIRDAYEIWKKEINRKIENEKKITIKEGVESKIEYMKNMI